MSIDNDVAYPKSQAAASSTLKIVLVKLLKLFEEFVMIFGLDSNAIVAHFHS